MDNKKEIVLSVKDLTTTLLVGGERFAPVERLSFDLHRGKTLALVGESGCGKTLAALSLIGLLPKPPALPPQGEIWYQERNLLQLTEKEMRSIRGGKISMIFQDPMSALNPVYTIGMQLMESAEIHLNADEEEAKKRALDALEAVGISNGRDRLESYPHELSGGMKQRVLIAMSLICEPDILIADEPTTALDTTLQAQVLDLIKAYQKKHGMALLLITHDMGVVAKMADDALVMYLAQAVERGKTDALFLSPAHPYTEGLFQSIPRVEKKLPLKPIRGQVPSFQEMPQGCRFHPRCPYAMNKCREGVVPTWQVDKETDHFAACWLQDRSQESQEKFLFVTGRKKDDSYLNR